MTTEQLPRIDAALPARRRRFGARSIVRRVLKPLAMVAVAGTLAITLTVTTTQKAEANPLIFAPPIIAGAAEVALGPAAWAAAVTPVGWAILGTVALGAGLYYTKDYWLPYVNGTFGQSKPIEQKPAPPGTSGIDQRVSLTTSTPGANGWTRNLGVVTLAPPANETPTDHPYQVSYFIHCRSNPNGTGTNTDKSGWFSSTYTPTTGRNYTFQAVCDYGYQTGGVFGAVGADPKLVASANNSAPFPTNVVYWGDMTSQAPGFDPASPQTRYNTTVECIKADGTKFSLTAESTGDQKGVKVPSCSASVPGSHGTGKTTVDGFAPGTTTPERIFDQPAITPAANQPLCAPSRPGPGCVLSVSLDSKPCVIGEVQCANWMEIAQSTPARVQCNYGPYAVAVGSCNMLERAYEIGGSPTTQENTDGNPATRNDNDPANQPINKPSSPDAGTGTGTGTIPGVGGQTSPNASPSEQACFPSGWAALNPVEWVLKPVGCALTAAFVPKPEVVTQQTTRLDTKIKNVGFARISTAWLSTFQAAGGGSGCTGPTVNFDMEGVHQSFQPFNACSQPMAGVAATTNAISAVFIVLFGGLGIMRALGAAFGFNFSMGRGGDGD